MPVFKEDTGKMPVFERTPRENAGCKKWLVSVHRTVVRRAFQGKASVNQCKWHILIKCIPGNSCIWVFLSESKGEFMAHYKEMHPRKRDIPHIQLCEQHIATPMFQNIWGYLFLKRNTLECELLVETERGKQQCSSKKSTLRGVLSLTVCRFCKSCLEMPQTGWITAEACLLLNFYCNLLLLNFYCSPLLNFYSNLLLLKPQQYWVNIRRPILVCCCDWHRPKSRQLCFLCLRKRERRNKNWADEM